MPDQPNETIQPLTENPTALAALLEAVREAVENASADVYRDPAVRDAALDLSAVISHKMYKASQ